MKKLLLIIVLGVIVFSITGCTEPVLVGTAVPGFWTGLWHGLIILWSYIFSLFGFTGGMWSCVNTGLGYNTGFITGVMTLMVSNAFAVKNRYKGK